MEENHLRDALNCVPSGRLKTMAAASTCSRNDASRINDKHWAAMFQAVILTACEVLEARHDDEQSIFEPYEEVMQPFKVLAVETPE
jgi:hypothetical protein